MKNIKNTAKISKILDELAQEKTKRILLETNLETKNKRLNLMTKRKSKTEEEKELSHANNKKLLENNKQLLKSLKNQLIKQKESEEILKDMTKKCDDFQNENKTLKRLYDEEIKKSSKIYKQPEETFVDFDNWSETSNSDENEIREVPEGAVEEPVKQKPLNVFKCNKCNFKSVHNTILMNHIQSTHKNVHFENATNNVGIKPQMENQLRSNQAASNQTRKQVKAI